MSSKTIGVVVPYLYDPFFATCAHAISSVAREYGYSIILTTSDEKPDIEQKQTNLMLRRRVEGMIVIPVTGSEDYYRTNNFSGVPVVTLDRPSPGSRFDSVLVPNQAGAEMALNHLISHGHETIAFLGLNRSLYTMRARYAGYRNAMTSAGRAPHLYIDCESPQKTVEVLRNLLNRENHPTALFSANNLTMKYVLSALSALGVEIPRHIALVGFDDFEMAEVLHPALTVIRQPIYELGEKAAEILFERIAGSGLPKSGQRVLLPLELILRRSCGCPAPDFHAFRNTGAASRRDQPFIVASDEA